MKWIWFAALSCCTLTLPAQEKFEKEFRLKEEAVPAAAIAFMDAAQLECKIRWFREESQLGTTLEAKFKHQGTHYSIEFDAAGFILDVEYEIPLSAIPEALVHQMHANLDSMFTRHRIIRIQHHLEGDRDFLLQFLQQDAIHNQLTALYEMEVKAATSGQPALYEATMDHQGRLIGILKIVSRNTDLLEY
jgi:hypothetical protein